MMIANVVFGIAAFATAWQEPVPKPMEFKGTEWAIQDGDKTKQFPAILRYESEQIYLAFTIPAKKDPIPPRQIAYRDVKSAEYTFGKSPRVAAALLLSPLFLFNSSKSHWLTVKTADDYVLLRLNKSNYKIAIAELEKRAGIKVESVGENK